MSSINNFGDGRGGVLSNERMDAIRRAMTVMNDLSDFERGYVMCWFCPTCGKYVGPGQSFCKHEPGENERLAARYRTEDANRPDIKFEGTRDSLERCAKMLETYAPDLYPANDVGQVHFARAMMESVADEIKAFLANHSKWKE